MQVSLPMMARMDPKALRLISEADFETAVMEYARALGWMVAHFKSAKMPSGKGATPMKGDPGFVDWVFARDEQMIHAELKTERVVMSAGQKQWRDAMGAHYLLWRPRDAAWIMDTLR